MSISCNRCGHDNPSDARFCLGCGTRLEAVCSACEQAWPLGAQFCGHCGASLNAEVRDQVLGPLLPASERRHVTILFADIAGFTLMAERFDPELVAVVVNDCFRALGEVSHRYGGVIDKFMGDSMMVLFGAPRAHDDDPARAQHAAIAMRRRLETFNAELALRFEMDGLFTGPSPDPLQIHIGINTGEVFAGSVGSTQRRDYTVMGDAVNLAARLQEAAETGKIFVSEETFRLTQDLFDYQPLPPLQVKGKREPVNVYCLLGERASARPGRGLPGLGSPLVGRRREFHFLWHCLSQLVTGEGRAVAVIGEAGIGKSRLATEVRCAVSAEPLQWAEGRSLAYGQPVSYGVFTQIFHVLLGVGPEASESLVRQRLTAQLHTLLPAHSDRDAFYLGHLLNLPLTREQTARFRFLDDRTLQQQTVQAVIRFISAAARQVPLVLVFEDLHWADAASVELLGRLLPLTASAPLMILWVTRPDRGSNAWPLVEMAQAELGDCFDQVGLGSLSEDEVDQMARNLLAAELDHTSSVTRELILGRAGGNPLFMEEVIHSLLDHDALELDSGKWRVRSGMESRLPATLRGVLVARIDHLAVVDRQVLQRAAVLGRIFPHRLLQLVVDPGIDLEQSLLHLEQEEMIRPLAERMEQTFIFKHVLIQEAAYDGLLLSQRRVIHRQAGESLERLYADRLEEQLASLAHHFQEGQVWPKAFDYLEQAAHRAQQTCANEEALGYYQQAEEILPRLDPGLQRDRRHFALLQQSDLVHDRLGKRERQKAILDRMELLASQLADERLLAEAHVRKGRYLWLLGEYEASANVLRGAVSTLRAIDDRALLGRALTNLGAVYRYLNRFQEALEYQQEALRIARSTGNKRIQCRSLNSLGIIYSDLGQNDKARRRYQEGLAITEQMGNLYLQGTFSNNLAHMYFDSGEFSQARAGFQSSLDFARQAGDRRVETIALANIADMDWRLGDCEASLIGFQHSLDQDLAMRNKVGQASTQRNIGNVLRIVGRYGQALALLSEALAGHQKLDIQAHVAIDQQHLAMLYDDLGAYDRSEQHWRACQSLCETLDLKKTTVGVYCGLGRVAVQQGEPHRALDSLRRAEELARKAELRDDLMHVHNVQALAHLALEDLPAAETLARQALMLSDVGPSPHGRLTAQGILINIALQRGDGATAFQIAQMSWKHLQAIGHFDGSEAALAYTCWLAAGAVGEQVKAEGFISWGYRALIEQAATLDAEPSLRRSFLENIPAHRAVMLLHEK